MEKSLIRGEKPVFTFTLNGAVVSAGEDMNLLTYLRDVCHLTAAKNGCSEGACGTCTVLIDGRAAKACLKKLSTVEGHTVTTLEGLPEREAEIWAYAFARAGAVQCGFCTPGMIMCGKALVDANPNPTEADVKKAIRGNICRCTGYVKIEKAILLAASVLRGESSMEPDDASGTGVSAVRNDAIMKAHGKADYCDDLYLKGMLTGKPVRCGLPRAKLLSLDVSEARALPGVEAVLTAEDVPGSNIDGYFIHDVPTLIPVGSVTHCASDPIALIAAVDRDTAEAAAKLVHAEYEIYSPVTDPLAALAPDAPLLHEVGNLLSRTHIICGDPEKAFAGAAHVVRRSFSLPFSEHAFLEPESSVAYYDGDVLTVYTSSQSIFFNLRGLCHILGLPQGKLRVKSRYVGGAFGGKEDLHVQHFAALLTHATKKPVKCTASRQESLQFHPKRHPMRIDYALACDAEGNFTGVKANIVSDTGAYASLGTAVVYRACSHITGPYRTPSYDVDGCAVYTNNPPAGAFRGFGVPQVNFAGEVVIDQMARELKRDPFDLRLQNALQPGDVMATGQLCGDDTDLVETMRAVEPAYRAAMAAGKPVGLACGYKCVGLGGGLEDTGRVELIVRNGRVVISTAAQCLGQGLGVTMAQIASEVTGLPVNRFDNPLPDSFVTPDSGSSTASRQTSITGEAVRQAAVALRQDMERLSLEQLEGRAYPGVFSPVTQKINEPGVEHPNVQLWYGYATHLAVLDADGRVDTIVAAHDVGRSINPVNIEGQIEGGVAMGFGYALTENFRVEGGIVKSRFGTIGLPRSTDMPNIVCKIVEKNPSELACGAKGIGEITSIPTASAIANAYTAQSGVCPCELPLRHTPYNKL